MHRNHHLGGRPQFIGLSVPVHADTGGFLRRASALLLLACALALLPFGDGGVVQAQTATVLVSNIDQTAVSASSLASSDLAQEFTSGSYFDDYTLTSIELRLQVSGVSDFPTVKLFSGSAIGTEVATLAPPTDASAGSAAVYTFTAPTGTTLVRGTSYWVVAEGGAGTWSTTGTDQDETPAAGWSIADRFEARGPDSSSAFSVQSSGTALNIRANGTLNPSTLVALVSNTTQSGDSNASYTSDHGQAFTTGYNLTGYTASDVTIISEDAEGDDIALQICEVDESTHPTTTCTDLTAPGSSAAGPLLFSVPTATTLTLAERTTYMVVFKSPGGEQVVVDATTSDNEDSASLPYWEIRDLFQWKNGTAWQNGTNSRAIRIDIQGVVNPASATAPTAADGTVTTTEDTAYTFAEANFNFSATADGDTLASVQVLTLPASGTLTLSGSPVTVNQSVTKDQLDTGSLVYTPAADGYGSGYASFFFRVSGSTAASASAYSMTVDVTGVQEPATGAPVISGVALVGQPLTASISDIADPDGLPGTFAYQWKRYSADGNTYEANIGTNSNRYTLTASELGMKVKVEVGFTDNGGDSEGPLVSAAYPSSGTVGVPPLVSNTAQGSDSNARYTSDHGQAFTTGNNASGYTVTGVSIISEDAQGDDIALQICDVDTNTHPTTTCTDLTAPGSSARGPLLFTAPNATTLTTGTTYMVVFKSPGGEEVYVGATTRDSEDSTSLPGWEIRDLFQWKDGTAWQNGTNSRAIRIAIQGTVNPASTTAPTAADGTVTATEDTAYAFTAANFNFSATAGSDTLASVQILTLTADGTLALSGSPVTVNQSVTKDQLDAGSLVYTPPADGYGLGYASFTFRVMGSTEASTLAYSMTIDVTGTQEAATGMPTISGTAQARYTLTASTAGIADPDGLPRVFTYQWKRYAADGITYEANIGTNLNRYTLTASELGKKVLVEVRFTDNGGSSEGPLVSAAYPSSGTVGVPPLVSNTAQGSDSNASYTTSDHGQAFTTGFNSTGYTASGVTIISEDAEGDDIALQICEVDDSTHPTTCTDLTAPGSSAAGPLIFSVPNATTLTLAERTTYMVVFKSPGGEQVLVDATTSDNEDSASLPGWEIRDLFQWKNGTVWQNGSRSRAIRIDIQGVVNPASATAPTAADSTVTATEDTAYAFAATDFNFLATADGDTLASVKVLTLPARGTLTLNSVAVAADQSVTKDQLEAGNLTYTPPADGYGPGYASFRFKVMGSTEASTRSYSMTIDVTGTQDAATGMPTFSGSAKVGLVLTALTTAIRDRDGLGRFEYQWMRVDADGMSSPTDIGENSRRYLLTEADFGKRIRMRVDFTDGIGGDESRTSDAYPTSGTVQRIVPVLVPQAWEGAPRTSNGPIFTAGEQYRLLVITNKNLVSNTSDPDNRKDGPFYNGKVAEGVGVNTILAPHKDGFTALVSTTGDSSAMPPVPAAIARDNTETTGTGVPIYWFKGARVADDYADFYDDSWDSNSPRNHDGVILTGEASCTFTGSVSSGTPSHRPLGSTDFITRGCAGTRGTEIDRDVTNSAFNESGIYALSPVFRVSTPPTASDGFVHTNEDTDHVFTAADFNYSPGESGDPLANVKITGLPADGALTLDGTPLLIETDLPVTVTVEDLAEGDLTYTPPANARGLVFTSFRFKVNDGADDSAANYSMTIHVIAVNDPATGAPTISGVSIVGQPLTASTAGIADQDDLPSVFIYQWKRYAADGTTFEANIGADSMTYTLTESELGKKVLVEVSFRDRDGSSEGPLASAVYPANGTVGPPARQLVSNVGQPNRSGSNMDRDDLAQEFTTGSNQIGYTLTSIDMFLYGRSASQIAPTVTLHSGSAAGTKVADFTGPSSIGSGDINYTFTPTTAVTLSASTEYWVVAKDAGAESFWNNTARTGEDGGGALGWTIADVGQYRTAGTEAEFEDITVPFQLRINGTINNTPATGAPAITAANAFRVPAVLGVDLSGITDSSGVTNIAVTATYNWQRFDSTGTNLETNSIGTGSTYTLADADVGKTLKVVVSFTDDGGNREGPLISAATSVVLEAPNTAPTSDDIVVRMDEDTEYTLSSAIFPFTDEDSSDTLTSVKIVGLPAVGTLRLSDTAIAARDLPKTVTVDELTAGSLKYQPAANSSGPVRFTFKVNDGEDDSMDFNTLTFIVASVNDPATGAPGITGTAQVGQTLTATVGNIADVDGLPDPFLADPDTSFQWIRVDGGTETNISSATSSTYILMDDDLGMTIKVKVSFIDDDVYSETLTSAATATVSAAANTPATGAPTISGTPQVGQTLTASTTTIMDDNGLTGVSYTYQWIRVDGGDSDISGAMSSTYILVGDDLGKTIKVKVSFTDDASNSETLTSAATATVSAAPNTPATGAPTISGTPQVGQTLTASTTTIMDDNGLTGVSYTYQWIRVDGGDSDISGATSSTYILVGDDLGKTIKVKVSFTDDASNSETLTSAATATVSAAPNTPATGAPTISGTPQVGQTLTASTTTIMDDNGLTGVSYTYQWIRVDGGDSDISGATSSTYILVDDDLGKTIKVKVSFTDDASNSETLTSAATATVSAAPNTPATGAPTISGTPQVGQTLTASTTTIMDDNGLTGVSYTYQWIRVDGGDSDISGATSSTYILVGDDLGKTIKVKVSFTDDDVYSETLTSAATATVSAAPNTPATGAPTISGTPQVGQTLTASTTTIMDDNGLTGVSYTYQWIRVDGGDSDISGATSSTYILVDDDLGKTIKVKVSFTDDASNSETLTSAATATVSAAPNTPATGAPTISGTPQVGQTLTASTTTIMDDNGLTGVSYTYQWIRVDGGDSDISGATSSTYTLVGDDLGKTIKVKVSFTDDASNSETLTSAATATVSAAPNTPATGAPTISGTPQVGQTLTASTTTIMDDNGLTGVSYTYQWIRVDGGDSDISGATSSTYTLVGDDLGKTIKVKVSFTDDANNSETLTSAATATVSAAPNTPATGAPTISGTPQVGQTLTASTTTIMDDNGLTGVSYTYQWIRVDGGDSDISGATSSTYILVDDDLGKTIKVKVSFTDDASNSETLTSAAYPTNGTVQRITVSFGATTYMALEGGSVNVAVNLNVDPMRTVVIPIRATVQGTTTTADYSVPTSVTFTAGQMAKTITFTANQDTDDDDDDSVLLAFGMLPTGVSAGTTTTTTVNIIDDDGVPQVNNPAYGRPYIRGVTQVGYALSVHTLRSIGDRDGVPDVFDYQWKRYAADGTTFEANIGANSSSYRLTPSDLGKKIGVEVSFTDNEGNREGPLASINTPWLPTHAVGEATFQSIMGAGGDTVYAFTADHGQVFTTGTNPTGYTVSRVILTSEDPDGDDIAVQICDVDDSGNPTAVCTTLAGPGVFPKGLLSFTAPNGTTLAGGRTKYMVVIKSPGGDSVRVDATRSDGFDSSARDSGWSIGWRTRIKTTDGWQDVARTRIRIAILGTINP